MKSVNVNCVPVACEKWVGFHSHAVTSWNEHLIITRGLLRVYGLSPLVMAKCQKDISRSCLPETVLSLCTILENIRSVPGKRFELKIALPKVNQKVHQLPSWRHHPG